MCCLIACGLVFGPISFKKYATKPATAGVAMDVPEMVLVSSGPPIQAEVTSVPGENISTDKP